MAEGIPFQFQCQWRPQYEEEEYYYPPKDQCRGLQLLAKGYPLFHQCLCQSYGTGEPPLQECQCHRGRRVHFQDELPPQNQCGCRQPHGGGHPTQDECRCREIPIGDRHPPQDQCRSGLQLPIGHPPLDQCGRRQLSAGYGHPTQDQCRCREVPIGDRHPPLDQCPRRQVPAGDGHPPQDQCRGGPQLPAGDGQPPPDQCRGQQPPAGNPKLIREGFPLHDDQFPGQQQLQDGEQPKQSQNGGGKLIEVGDTPGDQYPGPQIPHQGPPVQPHSNFNGKKSMKNGGYYPDESSASGPARSLCTCVFIFLLLAGATILVLWLIYRPHKPRFTVVGAAIYDLNTTFPPFMSTTMQFTIIIRNPNKRLSIYYDKLSAFVSYKNQAITPEAMMPPLHMHKRTTVEVAPVIGGTPVQVSMEVANGLAIDEIYGVMGLNLVLEGRLRWKIVGAIKTKHYGIYVNCELILDLKKGCVGPVPLLGSPVCHVDI